MKLKSVVGTLATTSLTLVLTACDPIPGTLTVIKEIKIENNSTPQMIEFCRRNKTDYWCKDVDTENQPTTIVAGSHQAKLEFPNSREMSLEIKHNDEKNIIRFKLPKDAKIPSYSGDISLTSAQVGKPFDIAGRVDTDESDSESRSGIESCYYYVSDIECDHVVEVGPDGRSRSHRVCRTIQRRVPGMQHVTYHYHYTDKKLAMNLLTPGTEEIIARFAGATHKTDKVYTHQGVCR